ncbi:MAG: hypothetical protein QXX51_01325 [Candidatus Bathyarchaeia archaeon]
MTFKDGNGWRHRICSPDGNRKAGISDVCSWEQPDYTRQRADRGFIPFYVEAVCS